MLRWFQSAVFLLLIDVKRLAEKEDWVVDNEGITSLVSNESQSQTLSSQEQA